jgi:hypothetical protein
VTTRRIDWQAARERFVCGGDEVTHASLAREFGTKRETVSRRATREQWGEQRARFRYQTVTLLREKRSALEAERLSQQLDDALEVRGIARDALRRLRAPRRVRRRGKVVSLPSLLESEASLSEVRRLLLTAALLEREALDVEARVRVRLGAELEDMLRRAQRAFSPEVFGALLDLWAQPEGSDEDKA